MRTRPRSRLLLLALPLMLAACSAQDQDASDEIERDEAGVAAQQAAQSAAMPAAGDASTPPAPTCDASQVQGMVGQAADEGAVEQARVDAGAARARLLTPGQAVTMEFDGARLNIEVDEAGKVVSLRCG